MRKNREGESGHFPFRSGRFFCAGGQWYFTERGGIDHGPFATREEAEAQLARFLREVAAGSRQDPA